MIPIVHQCAIWLFTVILVNTISLAALVSTEEMGQQWAVDTANQAPVVADETVPISVTPVEKLATKAIESDTSGRLFSRQSKDTNLSGIANINAKTSAELLTGYKFKRLRPLTPHSFSARANTRSPGEISAVIDQFASLAWSQTKKIQPRYRVILDPGHGGTDPGTIGDKGLLEKNLTLDIANRVARLLRHSPMVGIEMTRHRDTGFSRGDRLKKIKSRKADLLVSLHFNNLPQSDVTLVESFYAGPENILESELGTHPKSGNLQVRNSGSRTVNLDFTQQSAKIAALLQKNIFDVVSGSNPGAINGGIKKDTLFILTQSYIPGTLIELSCLSNSEEEKRLESTAYRTDIAKAIASGLLDYFTEMDQTRGI